MKKISLLVICFLLFSALFVGCTAIEDSWKRSDFGTDYLALNEKITSIMKDMGNLKGDDTIGEMDSLAQKRTQYIQEYLPKLKADSLPQKYSPIRENITAALEKYIVSSEHIHTASEAYKTRDMSTYRIERDQSFDASREASQELKAAVDRLDKTT